MGSDRISAGFGSSGSWFGALKSVGFGFGFSFVDAQWITVSNKNSCFIVYLIITLFI